VIGKKNPPPQDGGEGLPEREGLPYQVLGT
jgi:hypothetical protein